MFRLYEKIIPERIRLENELIRQQGHFAATFRLPD
jgi:hypothetical protein